MNLIELLKDFYASSILLVQSFHDFLTNIRNIVSKLTSDYVFYTYLYGKGRWFRVEINEYTFRIIQDNYRTYITFVNGISYYERLVAVKICNNNSIFDNLVELINEEENLQSMHNVEFLDKIKLLLKIYKELEINENNYDEFISYIKPFIEHKYFGIFTILDETLYNYFPIFKRKFKIDVWVLNMDEKFEKVFSINWHELSNLLSTTIIIKPYQTKEIEMIKNLTIKFIKTAYAFKTFVNLID